MSTIGTAERPLRVAIVGAGPSGFFAAGALFKKTKKTGQVVHVDLFDKLPAPFGLVRYGVAPDHPEIKMVERVYAKTASKPGFRFFGNVCFGEDIHLDEMLEMYDQVIFTVGAQTDRRLNIEGEDLPGSYSATEFVAWYNGHPEYADRTFDLSHPNVVVIGAGNVAMDVARILAKSPEELAKTDIADHALEVLKESKVKDIYVLARRGPVQAKFTTPEIKEFGELAICEPAVSADDLKLDADSAEALEGNRTATNNLRVLTEYTERDPDAKERRVHFRFLVSPVEVLGDGKVEVVKCVRNQLEKLENGYINAVPTEEHFEIPAGMMLRSVGYRGVELPGLPYESRRGTIPNEAGRVIQDGGDVVDRVYVAGWAKRGPSGVIGTNKQCATETVGAALEDVAQLEVSALSSEGSIVDLLEERGVDYVTFDDWQKIDEYERRVGEPLGRPRVKLVRIADMLARR